MSIEYTDDFLNDRIKTHGNFSHVAHTYQRLKTAVAGSEYFSTMDATQKTALEMILYKVSRVVNGNPNEPDHWKDIAGYANLVISHLKEPNNEIKI